MSVWIIYISCVRVYSQLNRFNIFGKDNMVMFNIDNKGIGETGSLIDYDGFVV